MSPARINRYDAETIKLLEDAGIPNPLLDRVSDMATELAELYAAAQEPKVTWVIPISYARDLHKFLHRNMPGGYQAHHDALLDAIRRASDD